MIQWLRSREDLVEAALKGEVLASSVSGMSIFQGVPRLCFTHRIYHQRTLIRRSPSLDMMDDELVALPSMRICLLHILNVILMIS